MDKQQDDVEVGAPLLYPSMQENPEFRLAFIRKVYSILSLQLLITFGFAILVSDNKPFATFFNTWIGWGILIFVVVFALLVLCPLYIFRNTHPLNFIFLGIFTLCYAFLIGTASAFISGKVVVETVLVTMVVLISLTVYTFWAARRGEDFGFLIPLMLSILVIVLMFTILQIFYPLGKLSEMIYSGIFVIIFCAYVIIDTDTLIKRCTYDDYIWAAASLYIDVLNIFMQLLSILTRTNGN